MSTYAVLKFIHIISATVLFGTGIGIAFFKWSIDRSSDVAAIRAVSERVVTADWLFTLPAAIVQPLSGLALVIYVGYPLTSLWLAGAIVLYAIAGACWIRAVVLQIKSRDLARTAELESRPLDPRFARYNSEWIWLGLVAFSLFLVIFWLMIARPL